MVEVKVQQGWLSGEKLDTAQGDGQYYSFKGIPYAEPPVGKLRFKAPRPPLPWDGIRNATVHGPICHQCDIFTQDFEDGNEDSLYLNIYSPELNPASPLPVMVFIHGGGYKSGSGNTDNYGPDFLVTHGVILVTINYRLDALGFLCLDTEEVPGNAGMKDQVAALKWVKENISNFGGDPDNVTIFGESAGGASCALHILSPMSKGLFRRAISMSGVPNCDWSIAYKPQLRARVLAKQLGCDSDDLNEILAYLQQLPVQKLINTNPAILSFEVHNNKILKMYHFTPVIEKDFGQECFLIEDPFKTLEEGKINTADILIGHTSQEGLIFSDNIPSYMEEYDKYLDLVVPRKLLIRFNQDKILEFSQRICSHYFSGKSISVGSPKEFMKFINDSSIAYDVKRFITKLPKVKNSRLYLYQFSCVSNRNVYGNLGSKIGMRGAAHLDDLLYLMDAKKYNMKIEKNTKEYNLVQLVCTVFTNFAKYGNPTPDSSLGVIWPEYNNETKPYGDIGDSLTIGTNLDSDTYNFWRNLYAEVGLEY